MTTATAPASRAWGHSLSTVASTNEPFAWAISADNKSVVGADTDVYFQMTVMSPGRIEMYHSHNGKAYQVNRRDMLYDGMGEKVGPQSQDLKNTHRTNLPKPHSESLGKPHV